jgi:O-antigen/teichoic acid export membrane protein|tara:strand:- start:825 stop:2141 length:1317 start_codon:yes stop_codon:yes gene_type:complete
MEPTRQGAPVNDLFRAKLFRDFSGTMLWQVLGKLFQVVGMVYATRCLGPDNIGVSRTIITLAMTLQLCLAFGLDAVAVRHVAKGTAKADGIAPAIFTFRLVLGLVAAVLWAAGVCLSPLEGLERWTWLAGALFLLVLSLDYSWLFQATEQMPRASRFQLLSSVAASLWFILFFEKGQALGSDLFVLLVANALVVGFVWWRMSRELGFRCLSLKRLAKAGALFREAWLIWAFNLSYFLLANMALPITFFLSKKYTDIGLDSGLFASAQQLVIALQMFLHYFGIIMAPRLVVWRQADVDLFRRRVLLLAGGAAAVGLLFSGGLWLIVGWLYPMIYGVAFTADEPLAGQTAGLLPVLVLGKFFAVGTAMFTWALWAEHRDKLPVLCCLPCCLISGALYFWLLPIHGNTAAAWLTLGAESALMLFSALAFTWAARQSRLKLA